MNWIKSLYRESWKLLIAASVIASGLAGAAITFDLQGAVWYEADHFFIHSQQQAILECVVDDWLQIQCQS